MFVQVKAGCPYLGTHNPLRYRGYVYDTETELYYLQSRYYDPSLGRFLNADAYASTGQGPLGTNMFAYCLNNPACYIDDSGCIALPIPSLGDLYRIHKRVQYEVVEKEGYAMEVYVSGPKGKGFLDLYDAENNQYYEVKSSLQQGTKHTRDQMEKYDAAKVTSWLFVGYAIDSSPTRGKRSDISGMFEYLYWDVRYTSNGDGLITYKLILNKSRYELHLATIALSVSAGALGVMYGLISGGHKGLATEYLDSQ